MKKEQLIAELQKFPDDTEVCIFDWRKNLHYADEAVSGDGIHAEFTVEELECMGDVKVITLSFVNDDYTEDGEKAE